MPVCILCNNVCMSAAITNHLPYFLDHKLLPRATGTVERVPGTYTNQNKTTNNMIPSPTLRRWMLWYSARSSWRNSWRVGSVLSQPGTERWAYDCQFTWISRRQHTLHLPRRLIYLGPTFLCPINGNCHWTLLVGYRTGDTWDHLWLLACNLCSL